VDQVTTFTIGWAHGEAQVASPDEMEAMLDRLAADPRGPFLTHIAPDSADPDRAALIELVFGCRDRAMLTYADDDFGGTAVEPGLPEPDTELTYDQGAVEPYRSRLSAAAARRAVVEFVATGRRPSGLDWL
jgi:hypothetical protein